MLLIVDLLIINAVRTAMRKCRFRIAKCLFAHVNKFALPYEKTTLLLSICKKKVHENAPRPADARPGSVGILLCLQRLRIRKSTKNDFISLLRWRGYIRYHSKW